MYARADSAVVLGDAGKIGVWEGTWTLPNKNRSLSHLAPTIVNNLES